jgi:hypothetical protein
MKITGTVVDKNRNLNVDEMKNALVQELKKRHADVRINYKSEVEWSAQNLSSVLKSLVFLLDKKASRIAGTKGIIRFNMNVHGAWDILFEISILVRLFYTLLLSLIGLFWFYRAASAEIPAFMKWSVVGFLILGLAIDYLTLKYTFAGMIKNEIKKARKTAESIRMSEQ